MDMMVDDEIEVTRTCLPVYSFHDLRVEIQVDASLLDPVLLCHVTESNSWSVDAYQHGQ